MAFSKTPMGDTYQTKLVPLIKPLSNRTPDSAYSPNYDMDPLNVIYERTRDSLTGEDFYTVMSRDGITPFKNMTADMPGGDIVFGVYLWTRPGIYVVVTSTRLLRYSAATLALLGTTTITSGTFPRADFQEFTFDSGSAVLVVSTPGGMYSVSLAGTATALAAAPATVGRAFGVMDGYVFATDGISIWNSQLNDPTVWPPSNFLDAEAYPGTIQGLFRLGTYIVAMCTQSIQFFYNAANATGSPLAVNQGATKRVGTLGAECQVGDAIFFVGMDNNIGLDVYQVSEQQVRSVGNPTVRKWLSSITPVFGSNGLFPPGNVLVMNGHRIYVINQSSTPYTYGYDLETQEWIRFSGLGATSLRIASSNFGYWSAGSNAVAYTSIFVTNLSKYIYRIDASSGSDQVGGGATIPIPVRVVTDNLDFDTRRIKFGSRLLVHCDQVASSSMNISWSDDDYQTFNTPRAISATTSFPVIHQLGSFRKRAFKMDYAGGQKMRWEFLELDYDQGQT